MSCQNHGTAAALVSAVTAPKHGALHLCVCSDYNVLLSLASSLT